MQVYRKKKKSYRDKMIFLEDITQKMKEVVIDKEYEIDLFVSIHCAEGLDDPNIHHGVISRYYSVVFWVHPNGEYRTDYAQGLPNPVWDERRRILLDKSLDTSFLYVEVLRYNPPGSEPATGSSSSADFIVVGRARIPLPKLFKRKCVRQGLVRFQGDGCKAEGHIIVTLETKKIVFHCLD